MPENSKDKTISIKEKKTLFDDFVKVEQWDFTYRKREGGESDRIRRIIAGKEDACACLIYHREHKKYLLVEQFRAATTPAYDGWMEEIVAGYVDEGESKNDAVLREIREETGYKPESVSLLHTFYPSPGAFNERVYLYCCQVDESCKVGEGGGVDAHEDLKAVWVSIEEIEEGLRDGRWKDAKTIIALQHAVLTKNRE